MFGIDWDCDGVETVFDDILSEYFLCENDNKEKEPTYEDGNVHSR